MNEDEKPSDSIYDFSKEIDMLYLCKGAKTIANDLLYKKIVMKDKNVESILVNTMRYKDRVLRDKLKRIPSDIGYMWFPQDYDIKYFKSLVSESKKVVFQGGQRKGYEYIKSRKNNEALDCRVYSECALDFLKGELEAHIEMELDHNEFLKAYTEYEY